MKISCLRQDLHKELRKAITVIAIVDKSPFVNPCAGRRVGAKSERLNWKLFLPAFPHKTVSSGFNELLSFIEINSVQCENDEPL